MKLWLQVAKSLPAGGHRKIICCGAEPSMRVENGERGYRAYCFRCHRSEYETHGTFSIANLRQRHAEFLVSQRGRSSKISLPDDHTENIPAEGSVWLYRASISSEVARSYRFEWSPGLRRVLLTVYGDSCLQGYTARAIDPGVKPKYIERFSDDCLFWSKPGLMPDTLSGSQASNLPDVCVTEDILSAVRVGYSLRRVCAIMGTSASPVVLNQIAMAASASCAETKHAVPTVALWLDTDGAGHRGAVKVGRALELMGMDVWTIRSGKDPKRHTNEEIREFLVDRRNLASDSEAS